MGYHRYWITEHQPQPSPTTILPLLAERTKRIRVGSAGILARYYAPPRTALDFLFLEALFPGRIDAGLCAGFVAPPFSEDFFSGEGSEEEAHKVYREKATLIAEYIRGARPPSARRPSAVPELWIHGSGFGGARLAASLSAAFGYSLFLRGSMDKTDAVDLYRDEFVGREGVEAPRVLVATAGVCAATDAAAREIADQHQNPFVVPILVGSPERCADELAELASRYGTKEITFMDVCTRLYQRIACYRLLAEALASLGLSFDAGTDCPPEGLV